MQIRIEENSGVSICRVKGDIDINTSPEVKKFLEPVIRGKKNKVMIDFSEVNYVDSSGLATLVEVLKNMKLYGGKLKLVSLSSKVMGLFEITKLNKLFDIKTDENSALSSF
ncbi:MAG TPA: STAS domain-containing protein [Candidatus Omnitrophota bacterium]|nr:STAS domain-containing protein [Candidatus Omnitrophota bacterium]HPS20061.1 STAS domain-containing protein [Candidatus Omnitrophota bacterium]